MSRRKTTDIFKREVYEINKNIEILGEYRNNKTPIPFKCKVCNHEWSPLPTNLLKGCGCPKCGNATSGAKQRKTTNQFIKELADANPTIELIGEYRGALVEATFKCKECEYQWTTSSPCKLVTKEKTGCPRCAGQERKTYDMFVSEMRAVHGDSIEVVSYTSTQVPARLKCTKCDREWDSLASNCLYSGKGCINCESKHKREDELEILLRAKFNNVERYVRFDGLVGVGGGLLSYDFLVVSDTGKYLIEHQGIQHEKPIEYFGGKRQFETQKEHDNRKKDYAQNNGYQYVEIWYYDNLNEKVEELI